MKNLFLVLILCPFYNFGQNETSIVNPKGKFYVGLEAGINNVLVGDGDYKQTGQIGICTDYYVTKGLIVSARAKYFKTAFSLFVYAHTVKNNYLLFESENRNPTYWANYESDILAIPINIKYEFRLGKKFGLVPKIGIAHNIEFNRKFDYSDNLETEYSKNFQSFNTGVGCTYFLNKKMALYADFEVFLSEKAIRAKPKVDNVDKSHSLTNGLFNVGIKYSLN